MTTRKGSAPRAQLIDACWQSYKRDEVMRQPYCRVAVIRFCLAKRDFAVVNLERLAVDIATSG
jgi:hypothetical protein